jgi:hypothetical protein
MNVTQNIHCWSSLKKNTSTFGPFSDAHPTDSCLDSEKPTFQLLVEPLLSHSRHYNYLLELRRKKIPHVVCRKVCMKQVFVKHYCHQSDNSMTVDMSKNLSSMWNIP